MLYYLQQNSEFDSVDQNFKFLLEFKYTQKGPICAFPMDLWSVDYHQNNGSCFGSARL